MRNGQNDIVGLMDNSGAVVVSYSYDSWGKSLTVSGTLATTLGANNPFRYRGYYYDTETELYYLQTRYYDAAVCRFISADVYMSTGQGIIGNNVYAYCLNNPVNASDPLGSRSGPDDDANNSGNGKPSFWQTVLNKLRKNVLNFDGIYYANGTKKNNFTPRKPARKGSENRGPTGNRERNVAHPEGEEHSRKPKGNRNGARGYNRSQALGIGVMAVSVFSVAVILADDITGAGLADDFALVPIIETFRQGFAMALGY